MDTWFEWLPRLQALLHHPLIRIGDTAVTTWGLVYAVLVVVALLWVARRVQRWVSEGPLLRQRLDPSARHAAGALARYSVLVVGLLAIVQTAGIDLTTFNVLAGAVGIGIGFGLQTVVSNFISGLIIMFERPIKIGDRIVVSGVEGNVVDIGARATTVLNNDNIAVIVPNSKFITEEVVNWKYNDDRVRFHIPVSVAYGSNARQVEQALLDCAAANADVLADPPPAVRFLAFGDDGLQFELRAWSDTQVDRKGRLVSSLNHAIYERFNADGIEFPFPQRDLHVKSGVLELRRAAPRDG